MALYVPKAFAIDDQDALDHLIDEHPFATLVTPSSPEPFVSHLPLLRRTGEDGKPVLIGHFAGANPHAQHATGIASIAIFHGPHAYVSPSWYPDKEAAARVPTWNYAVAHLQGTLELFDDEASLAELVDSLSRQHEARVGQSWRFEPDRDDHRVQLRGIIGFRFLVDTAALKFKLSQNHPVANRQSVAEQLQQQSREDSREVAELMRARTPLED